MQQLHDLAEECELTDRQRAGLVALLSEPSITQAARSAGVSRDSLYRWLREPDFSACYREGRRLVFDHGIGQLQQNVGRAAEVLREIMDDKAASPASRVAACDKVLVNARALLDPADIDRQIAELRARLERGE